MFFIGPDTYLTEPPRVIEKVLEFLVLDHAKKKIILWISKSFLLNSPPGH